MGRRRKRHLVRDKGHDRDETLDFAAVEVLLTSNRPLRHGRARSHLGQGCPGPCNTIKMCVGEAHGENGREGNGFFNRDEAKEMVGRMMMMMMMMMMIVPSRARLPTQEETSSIRLHRRDRDMCTDDGLWRQYGRCGGAHLHRRLVSVSALQVLDETLLVHGRLVDLVPSLGGRPVR